MVLGAQWLRTLGPILWDFSELSMAFKSGGRQYYGNQRQLVQEVGVHLMEQVLRKESLWGSLLVQPR